MINGNQFHFLTEGHCLLEILAECGPPAARVQECNTHCHFAVMETHATQTANVVRQGSPLSAAPSAHIHLQLRKGRASTLANFSCPKGVRGSQQR
jgi:hypothetical protein